MQCGFQSVEGGDMRQLEGQRLLASDAHGQQGETVTGQVWALGVPIAGFRKAAGPLVKIQQGFFGKFVHQVFDALNDAAVRHWRNSVETWRRALIAQPMPSDQFPQWLAAYKPRLLRSTLDPW